jgi:hypothetical protein
VGKGQISAHLRPTAFPFLIESDRGSGLCFGALCIAEAVSASAQPFEKKISRGARAASLSRQRRRRRISPNLSDIYGHFSELVGARLRA